MPDITMCGNKECPSREKCYRFMAKPNEYRQAFSDYEYAEDGKCSYFIKFNNFEAMQTPNVEVRGHALLRDPSSP